MPTGTLDRSPPPFFRQGPSALTRLAFFASLAVFLMAADTRLGLSGPLRTAVATVVHPVELALLRPVQALGALGDYFSTVNDARRAEEAARTSIALQAQRALQVETLTRENAALRGLLELNHRLEVRGHAAEVLYQAADPFSRKIVIDRGLLVGIKLASLLDKKIKNELLSSAILYSVGLLCSLLLLMLFSASATASVSIMAVITAAMHGINLMLISRVPIHFARYGRISTVSGI